MRRIEPETPETSEGERVSSVTSESVTTTVEGLKQCLGSQLGPTEWRVMTQAEVSRFADLTGDHNFIHVDPERAAQTLFGGTIAHGFFSLALLASATQHLNVTDAAASINYGLDRVRFPAPLPVGAQWRGAAEVTEVTDVRGGVQVKIAARIEVKGSDRPAVAAECLVRYLR
jgi:acyl dehydratase